MFEKATDDIKTEVLDHHGLVAAICEELQLKTKVVPFPENKFMKWCRITGRI